ncbi:MAG: cysteine-rich CWC family protein [Enterovibrio sp.]
MSTTQSGFFVDRENILKFRAFILDPSSCPLCGKANSCANFGDKNTAKSCWCNDPAITFPKELLSQIPANRRGKACICKSCALKFQNDKHD